MHRHVFRRPYPRSCLGDMSSTLSVGRSRVGRRPCLLVRSKPVIENEELLIGDCVALFSYCCYKQIQAICLSPDFPGFFAPLQFKPVRFLEFAGFSLTIIGTFVAVSYLTEGYSLKTSERLKLMLENAFYSWLISMPVDASWLVVTASIENGSLVGDTGWYDTLPLAARGFGEPYTTAAQILGVVSIWRGFYGTFLETTSFRRMDYIRQSREKDVENFVSTGIIVSVIAVIEFVILHILTEMNTSISQ